MLLLKSSFRKFYNHCNLIQRKSLAYINSLLSTWCQNYQEDQLTWFLNWKWRDWRTTQQRGSRCNSRSLISSTVWKVRHCMYICNPSIEGPGTGGPLHSQVSQGRQISLEFRGDPASNMMESDWGRQLTSASSFHTQGRAHTYIHTHRNRKEVCPISFDETN